MLVGRELRRIQEEHPDIEVEEIDVIVNPLKSWQDGIRMIPTLVTGEQKLSGVFLSAKEIKDFLSIP